MNSANYQWYGKLHTKYPEDYVKKVRSGNKVLAWDAPLSAILTIWPDGRIKIDGSKAGWLFGVTPAEAGYPLTDSDGRETLPVIQSADMKFTYT